MASAPPSAPPPGLVAGKALDDDFNTPVLIGVLFDAVRIVNQVNDHNASATEAGHRRVCLLQQRVGTGKELVERYEVTQRLTHLLAVDGNDSPAGIWSVLP